MRTTEFSISATHTFNLGNFESFKVEATVTIAVDVHDDYTKVRQEAQTKLKELLTETYKAQKRNAKRSKADGHEESIPESVSQDNRPGPAG